LIARVTTTRAIEHGGQYRAEEESREGVLAERVKRKEVGVARDDNVRLGRDGEGEIFVVVGIAAGGDLLRDLDHDSLTSEPLHERRTILPEDVPIEFRPQHHSDRRGPRARRIGS
jgi:hypothetical protein